MTLELYWIWYLIIGFLLGNGVPHFIFGVAGKVFRSPFGQKSKPKVNIAWGLTNFILATIIATALMALGLYDVYSLAVLLVGFWLVMLMFGTGIKRFLSQ